MIAVRKQARGLITPFYARDGGRNQAADAPLSKERHPPRPFSGASPFLLIICLSTLPAFMCAESAEVELLAGDREMVLAGQSSELVMLTIRVWQAPWRQRHALEQAQELRTSS